MDIPNNTVQEWINALKPYQSNSVSQLVDAYGEEEAIKRWLSANGPNSTIKFGGTGNSPEPFFFMFKEEFSKFICGDESYSKYREQLMAETPIAKTIYISCISAALGAALGYAATLLAPAVAIMLHIVGAMGVNAWCNQN